MDTDGTVDDSYPAAHPGYSKISDTEGEFTATLELGDLFGYSVDNMGDLNGDGVTDLAVGAFYDDDGGTNRGAVYILFLDADGTVDDAFPAATPGYQKISDTEGEFTATLDDSDNFGSGVARIDDLNGDGVDDLVVGAQTDDDGGDGRGAIYILYMDADGTVDDSYPSATPGYQKISDTEGGFTGTLVNHDNFGSSVAVIGDLDSNGNDDIVVGAYKVDDGGKDSSGGIFTIFMGSGYTVSGQLYTGITGSVSANKDINVLVNGVTVGTDTTDGSGNYSVTGVNYSANDIITAFIDGETQKAVTVTIGPDTPADINNLDVYYYYLKTTHENAGPITNANLDTANNGDPDITAIYADGSGSNLDLEKNLYIPSGKTYAPGGNINLAGTWSNQGAFTQGTYAVTLDGTTQSIKGTTTFYDLSKTSTAAEAIFFQNGNTQTVSGTLTLDGDESKVITIDSDFAGNTATINVTGAFGTLEHLDIIDNILQEGGVVKSPTLNLENTNFATTSTNSGNTEGWFTASLTYTPTVLIESQEINNGSIGDNPITIDLSGGAFSADVVSAEHVVATNVPAGLTPTFERVSDTQITFSLNDLATSHLTTDNINDLTITFDDDAFAFHTAAEVGDSTTDGITVGFYDPTEPTPTGGSPTMIFLSGAISDSTDDTAEDEAVDEEPLDEDEILDEEAPAEEPEEPAEPETPTEPELPNAPVIEAVVEPVYEYFVEPEPAPPAYQPPPTPPVEEPTEEPTEEPLSQSTEEAIGNYEPTPQEYPPVIEIISAGTTPIIREEIAFSAFGEEDTATVYIEGEAFVVTEEEFEELEIDLTGDLDGDGNADAFQLAYGESLFEEDSNINYKVFCGLDLLESDEIESLSSSNLESMTTGNQPAFRICSNVSGKAEVSYVNDETKLETYLGSAELDEENKGLFVPEIEIPDGKHYLVVKMGDETEISEFTVEAEAVPATPEVVMESPGEIGSVTNMILTLAPNFDKTRYLASMGTLTITGYTDPNMTIYIAYKSRVLSSVVFSDGNGKFETTPNKTFASLEKGEHEFFVYAQDGQNSLVSNVAILLFSK